MGVAVDDGNSGLIAFGLTLGVPATIFGGMVGYQMAEAFGQPGWAGVAGPAVTAASAAGLKLGNRWTETGRRHRAAAVAEVRRLRHLDGFAHHPALHDALRRLTDEWDAAELWLRPGIGLGRKPVGLDRGDWPRVLWDAGPEGPRPDIEALAIGARVGLTIPEGCDPADFKAKADKIAAALRVPEVRIARADSGRIWLDLRVHDPIREIAHSGLVIPETVADPAAPGGVRTVYRPAGPLDGPAAPSCHDDVVLFVSEFGELLTINFAKSVHTAIQGASRSGKSVTLQSMVTASMLMRRDTRTAIIDPNGGVVLPYWESADVVTDTPDGDEAAEILDEIRAELYKRKRLFARLRTDRIIEFDEDTPLWNVFVDEGSQYANSAKWLAAVERFTKQVAKFGGHMHFADQKLGAVSMPTSAMINTFDRFCHRVRTRHDIAHVFPDLEDYAAELRSPEFPQGVAVVSMMSHPAPVRARAVYLPAEACWDIGDALVAQFGPRRGPWEESGDGTGTNNTSTGDTSTAAAPAADDAAADRPRRAARAAGPADPPKLPPPTFTPPPKLPPNVRRLPANARD